MKRTIITTLAILFLLTGTAAAQTPTDKDEMGRPIRDNFEILTTLDDVPAGSTCSIGDLNNQSTYRPGVTIPNSDGQIDRGNILRVKTGRGGEHNGDWVSFPVERIEGAESIGEFVSGGDGFGGPDDVTVWVGFDWHNSIDDLIVECVPPPPVAPTTTTTVAPPTSTTTAPSETTTTIDTPTTTESTNSSTEAPPTTPPVDDCPDDGLACTGATSSRLLRIVLLSIATGLTLLVLARMTKA